MSEHQHTDEDVVAAVTTLLAQFVELANKQATQTSKLLTLLDIHRERLSATRERVDALEERLRAIESRR